MKRYTYILVIVHRRGIAIVSVLIAVVMPSAQVAARVPDLTPDRPAQQSRAVDLSLSSVGAPKFTGSAAALQPKQVVKLPR